MGQPWNSGLGGSLAYHTPNGAWHVLLGYGRGLNAIRHDERGGNNMGLLVQYDFTRTGTDFRDLWRHMNPSNWRGITR